MESCTFGAVLRVAVWGRRWAMKCFKNTVLVLVSLVTFHSKTHSINPAWLFKFINLTLSHLFIVVYDAITMMLVAKFYDNKWKISCQVDAEFLLILFIFTSSAHELHIDTPAVSPLRQLFLCTNWQASSMTRWFPSSIITRNFQITFGIILFFNKNNSSFDLR